MKESSSDVSRAQFSVGELVTHRLFHYRGVIIDVDASFQLTNEWYEIVAQSQPPKDIPWYHVLVHQAQHTTYVAERHLQAAAEPAQIEHPMLGRYFDCFDGARYFPKAPN